MMHKYGMKERGYSIGCQPAGVKKYQDGNKFETGYWSIIWYEEKLTKDQEERYELEYLGEEE